MRIRTRVLMTGPTILAMPGEILEVPEAFGRAAVEAGYAEELAAPPPLAPAGPTTATVPDPEAATLEAANEVAMLARPRRRGRPEPP